MEGYMMELECPHCKEHKMVPVPEDTTDEELEQIKRTMHDCDGALKAKREALIDKQVDKLFGDHADQGFAEIDENAVKDVKDAAKNVFHERCKNIVIALTKEERVRIASTGLKTIRMQRILTKKITADA